MWLLDGVGCAGARTGDDRLVGFTRMGSNAARACEVDGPGSPSCGGAAARCPLRPINVSSACKSHREGRFRMWDVVFEQRDDDLFVYPPEGSANERRCVTFF